MSCLVGLGLILLITLLNTEAQVINPSRNIRTKCLGNVLRVDVGPLGEKFLEVAGVKDNSATVLTPALASQCGFSVTMEEGNVKIYASIQNCFANNVNDQTFTTTLNIRLHGSHIVEEELYQVSETCQYAAWASRDIVCALNYMEVSVRRPAEVDAGSSITNVVFYTPSQKRSMTVAEANGSGYGIANSPTRLLLRSPRRSHETYIQNVAQTPVVPMRVLRTSLILENNRQATQIDATAACPEGTLSFSPNTITWFLPKHIDPLIDSSQYQLLEVHMGVDGQKVSTAEMAARRYSLSVNDVHIVIEIPIGADGGYYESHVQDGHYLTSYTIELMLELLWTEDGHKDTRYKVLFSITTPPIAQPPHKTTLSEDQAEYAPVPHPAYPQVSKHIVPPSVSGGCDHENFLVLVKYGTEGLHFQTIVGKRLLTQALAQQYGFVENGTHFSIVVPFSATDVAFEAVQASTIRSRLDVVLINPQSHRTIKDFSLACDFRSTLIECFPNGTMTALAVKLESVPSLNPGHLALRDPKCGPYHSDDRFAYFVFTGNTCGTTRKFLHNMMMYENEISLPDDLEMKRESKNDEPEYELKVFCYYDINRTHTVAFHARSRRSEPYAENARGEMQVEMRLAVDDSYSVFHRAEDYPVAKYLQQPLYFEVELMSSPNPQVSLELENCWATLDEDRTSRPRWNLIINGCENPADPYQLFLHPVWADARVQNPSHLKRFEIKMFAFAEDQDNLSRQLSVHCDVVICDARNPIGGACLGQCSNQENGIKGQKRAVSDIYSFKPVSSGTIFML